MKRLTTRFSSSLLFSFKPWNISQGFVIYAKMINLQIHIFKNYDNLAHGETAGLFIKTPKIDKLEKL